MTKKIVPWFIFGVLISTGGVLAPYCAHFWHGRLSSAPNAWAAFGSYVGGTLGPLVAIFGLIALLLTIRVQVEAWQTSKETARLQREYLERKERKEEWQSIIEHAEKQIRAQLDATVYLKSGTPTTLQRALYHVAAELVECNRIRDRAFADELFRKYLSDVDSRHFGPLAALVESLGTYLDRFSNYLVERDYEILSHYNSSYIGIVGRLGQIGVMTESETWNKVSFKNLKNNSEHDANVARCVT